MILIFFLHFEIWEFCHPTDELLACNTTVNLKYHTVEMNIPMDIMYFNYRETVTKILEVWSAGGTIFGRKKNQCMHFCFICYGYPKFQKFDQLRVQFSHNSQCMHLCFICYKNPPPPLLSLNTVNFHSRKSSINSKLWIGLDYEFLTLCRPTPKDLRSWWIDRFTNIFLRPTNELFH